MDYSHIIENEKRKRALLVAKVAESDKRISMLEAMRQEDRSWDALLEADSAKSAGATTMPTVPALIPDRQEMAQETNDVYRVPKKISPQWLELIEFLGTEGKSFEQVKAHLISTRNPLKEAAARTGLMNYRKEYDLISNPRPGFYAATERALNFIAARRDGLEDTL